MVRAALLAMVVACGGTQPAPREAPPPAVVTPPAAAGAQTVEDGARALCASGWDGQLEHGGLRTWIPDHLAARVTNDDVIKIVGSIGSHPGKLEHLDAFLAQNGLAAMACPLRDQWAAQLTGR